jgi:hypothetical protein
MVGRGIALLFLILGTRRGWVVSTTPRPLYSRENSVPIVQEAGWASGPVWTCAKNLTSIGIRSPDHPARSQSLYRLSYSAHGGDVGASHSQHVCITKKLIWSYRERNVIEKMYKFRRSFVFSFCLRNFKIQRYEYSIY